MSTPSSTPTRPQPHDDHARSASESAAVFRDHSAAEWVTLTISLLIIVSLVGLVIALSTNGGASPPRFVTTPLLDQTRHAEEAYYIPVAVTNLGGVTAQEVRIVGELTSPGGESVSAEFTIDVLAGGESLAGTMVFTTNPEEGQLAVTVESFR